MITGSGRNLRITSEGHTVRLGQRFAGGTSLTHDLSGIRRHLPRECRGAKLLQIGLGS